jgi:hypothetical protein
LARRPYARTMPRLEGSIIAATMTCHGKVPALADP